MAASKRKNKEIKQAYQPKEKEVRQRKNPDKYYNLHPAWNFSSCDPVKWSVNSKELHDCFWSEVFPRMQDWEKSVWKDIFLDAKKQNHSLEAGNLSAEAIKRAGQLYIEPDGILSLRLQGTHRIYGYIEDGIFNIVWLDLNHGDNDECVCRSHKKHT